MNGETRRETGGGGSQKRMEESEAFHGALYQIEGTAGPPEVEKVYDYYATTAGGLEEVALKDLKARLKGLKQVRMERDRRHGRVFFRYERSPRRLLELRSVENLFALLLEIRGVTVGQPGLLRIAEQVAKVDLAPAIALHDALYGEKPDFWFSLTCTAGRGHRFSASELHQVVQTVLCVKYGLEPEGEGPAYPLHLQVRGKRALFGLQLSERRMRDRDYRRANLPGGLTGSVAYCMALLGRVEGRDVCLDPMCGSGTTLIEAGQAFGPRALVGGDVTPEALDAARINAEAGDQKIGFVRWDAGGLPLKDASVDKLLCNLPYGKKTAHLHPQRQDLLLREFARVLRPGRRAVLLTEDRETMQKALQAPSVPFRLLQRLPVHLRGVNPAIFVLKRE